MCCLQSLYQLPKLTLAKYSLSLPLCELVCVRVLSILILYWTVSDGATLLRGPTGLDLASGKLIYTGTHKHTPMKGNYLVCTSP